MDYTLKFHIDDRTSRNLMIACPMWFQDDPYSTDDTEELAISSDFLSLDGKTNE